MRYRRFLVLLVILVSVALSPFVLGLKLDRTLKSAYVTSSPAYGLYKEFLDVFGNDEFILIAIRNDKGVGNSAFLRSLAVASAKLEDLPQIAQVLSISNLKVFRERKGVFGNYPLTEKRGEVLRLPDGKKLEDFSEAVPILHYLLSKDLKCAGIMIRLQDDWRFHPEMGEFLQKIRGLVQENVPQGSEIRLVGAPVLREAVQQLTLRTAVIFGVLCTLIIAVVSFYIFKSLRVAAIATVVVGVAVYWVMGLMSLLGVPLNSTTSLSFGLVLVVSVATVIHIVSHYYEVSQHVHDRVQAVRKALAIVVRPCLMCSLTTAVAFATIMISTIPMVQQLGLVMSLGVLIAFLLALLLTPAFLMVLRPVDPRIHDKMTTDWVAQVFERVGSFVFSRYKLCAISGIVFCIIMVSGAPLIQIDTQILRLFVDSSSELADIRSVEEHLTPVRTFELTVQLDTGAFKQPATWEKMRELERRLANMPEVAGMDSLLPLIVYLHGQLTEPGANREDLYKKKGLISQLLAVMTFNRDGRQMLRRYLSKDFGRIHVSIRTRSTDPAPVREIIEKIKSASKEVMGASGTVVVTGEQAVFAAQASEVVRSQVLSLILALSGVTALIIIQLRSWLLGLISIFPNLPPIVVIIGLMGWLGIPLDNVTVFAVAIAIGLAVDDTIHYLTQLRRDIAASNPGEDRVARILEQSYQTTAKTLISTSATLFFGFLALTLTPTQPAIYFGFLGAAAIFVALWGDLVFLPAMILTFPWLSRLIEREATRKATG